jgi:hypothetical protein
VTFSPKFGTATTVRVTWLGLLGVLCVQATTTSTNSNTVAPTLVVNATVQSSVSLTLATGSSGSPCTISSGGGGDYNISFGNVNGLGNGTPTCGTVTTTSSNATYATSYQLTATYAGQSSSSGTAVVLTTPGFTHSSILSLGDGSTTAGPFTAIPSSGSTVSIPATSSGTAISRALSLTVANTTGGSAFAGSDSATITFTLTVQ